jgi:predicted nucleotide-binding protein (sugar kinase/HSP70/actin superfamily)
MQEMVFRRLGYEGVPIITPSPGASAGYAGMLELINGNNSVSKLERLKFFKRFWQGISANEAVRQLVLSRRPYELQPGSMDRAYEEGLNRFRKAIAAGNIPKAAYDFFSDIMDVPIGDNDKVRIGIVGEGYVRVHEPSNNFAVRQLEDLGAVCFLPMTGSYLNYAVEQAARREGKAHLWLIRKLQEYLEHSICRHINPYLVFAEPSAAEVIERAAAFVPPTVNTEAVENIGIASGYAGAGIHGILNLIPSHCMPGSALQCYLETTHRQEGIPTLTIPLDGICDRGFRANLEVLVHRARLYRDSRV